MKKEQFPHLFSDEHIKACTVVLRVTAMLELGMHERYIGPRTAEYLVSMVGHTLRYRMYTHNN